MSIDYDRTLLLLTIIEKCAANPVFSAIAGEANVELGLTAASAQQDTTVRADKIRSQEQVAAQTVLSATPLEVDPPAKFSTEKDNHDQRRI